MKRYEEDYNYAEEEEQKPVWRAQEQEFGCAFCYDNRTKKILISIFLIVQITCAYQFIARLAAANFKR